MNLMIDKQLPHFKKDLTIVLRVTALLIFFCAFPSAIMPATGIKMSLGLPPISFATIDPYRPEIGLSTSLDSISLLKRDNIQGKVTGSYDANSEMLVLDQHYGKFTGMKLPLAVSPLGYRSLLLQSQSRTLWRDGCKVALKKTAQAGGGSLIQIELPFNAPKMIKSIMGEGGAGLKVNGSYRISFAGTSQWSDETSTATMKQSKFPSLNMEQVSRFQINGNIGSKITVKVDQDSKQQQTLANKLIVRYNGEEDDVIKTVELGNTNLSLPGTGYSQGIQGLFGIKTTAELAGLKLTAIASQEKSSTQSASFVASAKGEVKRDWQYLDDTYFDLTRRDSVLSPADLEQGDSITDLELYYSAPANYAKVSDIRKCSLYVDPFNKKTDPHGEAAGGDYLLFDKDQYTFFPTAHYLIMNQPITNVTLGVWMKYRHINDADTTFIDFGTRPVKDDLYHTLKLIRTSNPQPNYVTWNYVWRNVYDIGRVDDLDNLDVKIYRGSATSSSDKSPSDLDHQKGKPYIQILGLDNDKNGQIDSRNTQILDAARGHLRFLNLHPFADDSLSEKADTLYNSNSQTVRSQNSKYYLLYINPSARSSTFSLGRLDILPKSETVTLNGKPLKVDADYQISYQTGQITFLNQDAMNPNADLRVSYEYAPLIAAQKKSLLGVRGEYELRRDLKVGTAVLYKSEKSTDRKPRLGEEQSSFLYINSDASYKFASQGLTRLLDALPLLETKTPSTVSFSGELGQSYPNPNLNGEAYIDDFESSRERISLGITREGWHFASPPAVEEDTSEATGSKKGHLIWYNPFGQVPISEIYQRDTKPGENLTNVLVLRFSPNGDGARRSWGGVMKALSASTYDQSKTQFIELRLKGKVGTLHIDFGQITEDLNGDSTLNTEDLNGNGLLEDSEDIGLPGTSDTNCVWGYDSNKPDDYESINCTKGNGKDPGMRGRPVTEDINSNGALDLKNEYFSFAVDLSDTPGNRFFVPNSENANGWYSLRIPFQDSLLSGKERSPSRGNITNARIWIDSVGQKDTAYVMIAEVELTRNAWEVQPLLPKTTNRDDSAGIKIAVVNTEENNDYRADPPPGVTGYTDPTTQLTEKEQSLSLKFVQLAPGDTGFAEKRAYKAQDLTGYRKLQMWVHGDSTRDNAQFFFRFGSDSKNFYEYYSKIRKGWSDSTSVNITFDDITQLKLKLEREQISSPGINETRYMNYRLVGKPTLTQIQYYAVGVINIRKGDENALSWDTKETGELWIDELRTTSVRNDRGVSATARTDVALGDLGSIGGSYSRTNAFFRRLTGGGMSNLGSGSENTAYGYGVSFNLDRFLSPNEKASMPISYNWSKAVISPRLITGSDIAVTGAEVDSQKTTSISSSFSIRESWSKQTKNPIYTLLLNQFSSNFSFNRSRSTGPVQPLNESESYQASGRYSLTSPLKRGARIFSWLKGMPLIPTRVLGTEFNPIPSRLSVNGAVNRTQSHSVNTYQIATNKYTRTFKGGLETGATPINSMSIAFAMSTDRDLLAKPVLSFDPKKFKLGDERSYSQKFSIDYGPSILPFVTGTKFSFTADYGEVLPTAQSTVTTRTIRSGKSFNAGGSFSLQKLFGQTKHAPKAPEIMSPKGDQKDKEKGKEKDKGKNKDKDKDKKSPPLLDSLKEAADTSGVAPFSPKDSVKSQVDDSNKDKGKNKDKDKDKKSPPLDSLKGATDTSGVAPFSPKDSVESQVDDSNKDKKKDKSKDRDEESGKDKLKESALGAGQSNVDSTLVKHDSLSATGQATPKPPTPKIPGGTGDTTRSVPDSVRIEDKDAHKLPKLDSLRHGIDSSTFVPDSLRGKVVKPKAPKVPGKPVYMYGLNFIRFFTDRIDPIVATYHWEKNAFLGGFVKRPNFLFRFGFTDNWGEWNVDRVATSATSGQQDGLSRGRSYKLSSGVKLILDIRANTSWTLTKSEASGKSTRDESTTFPDVQFVFGRLDFLILPKFFSSNFTLDSKFRRQTSKSIPITTGVPYGVVTTTDFSPLVGATINWKYATGLKTTVIYTKTKIENAQYTTYNTDSLSAKTRNFSYSLMITSSYSFKGGSKLWLPLLGKVKIQSTLSFDVSISERISRSEDHNPIRPLGITAETKEFSVQPRVSYNFSTNIKGGLEATWKDSEDRRTNKKSHIRSLSLWAEIRF